MFLHVFPSQRFIRVEISLPVAHRAHFSELLIPWHGLIMVGGQSRACGESPKFLARIPNGVRAASRGSSRRPRGRGHRVRLAFHRKHGCEPLPKGLGALGLGIHLPRASAYASAGQHNTNPSVTTPASPNQVARLRVFLESVNVMHFNIGCRAAKRAYTRPGWPALRGLHTVTLRPVADLPNRLSP